MIAPRTGWQRMFRIVMMLVVIVVVGGLCLLFAIRLASGRPDNLGAIDGRLADCPNSPNCVSSLASVHDRFHKIEPLTFEGPPEDALRRLKEIVTAMPRAQLVTFDEDYMHIEFTSKYCRFIDDMEFLIDEEFRAIEIRSASRIGHGDMGVNRQRTEAIRTAFDQSD